MLASEGLVFIEVAAEKLPALENCKAIPEELETALVEAQTGMKRECKADKFNLLCMNML